MEVELALKAFLGIVEGLTEFLPVSSTGHLIIAGGLLGFNDEKGKVFEIVIQTGAMLAVCWEYRARFARRAARTGSRTRPRSVLSLNLIVAFMPAAVLGLAFGKHIKAQLFKPVPVAIALDRRRRWSSCGPSGACTASRVESVDDMTWKRCAEGRLCPGALR